MFQRLPFLGVFVGRCLCFNLMILIDINLSRVICSPNDFVQPQLDPLILQTSLHIFLCFGGWLQEDDQGDEVFSGSMSFANYSHFKAEKSDQFWSGLQPRIVSQPVLSGWRLRLHGG